MPLNRSGLADAKSCQVLSRKPPTPDDEEREEFLPVPSMPPDRAFVGGARLPGTTSGSRRGTTSEGTSSRGLSALLVQRQIRQRLLQPRQIRLLLLQLVLLLRPEIRRRLLLRSPLAPLSALEPFRQPAKHRLAGVVAAPRHQAGAEIPQRPQPSPLPLRRRHHVSLRSASQRLAKQRQEAPLDRRRVDLRQLRLLHELPRDRAVVDRCVSRGR